VTKAPRRRNRVNTEAYGSAFENRRRRV